MRAGAKRFHIIGGPGSGKTSLAVKVGSLTGAPVHHLDHLARVGGGNGPVRPLAERERMVAEIVATDAWITDGIHLGWTVPLLESADVIIWLDHVSWLGASRRISQRFTEGGIRELMARKGRQRALRFRDYGRHARAFGGAILATRHYYAGRVLASAGSDASSEVVSPDDTLGSRMATEVHLAPYRNKIIHCRTGADIAAFLDQVAR
jgi:hypothetical protein